MDLTQWENAASARRTPEHVIRECTPADKANRSTGGGVLCSPLVLGLVIPAEPALAEFANRVKVQCVTLQG